MITGYDAYKDSAAGRRRPRGQPQTKNWVVPVHPGAVKALKEAGHWTDDQEAYNNAPVQAAGRSGGGVGGLHQVQPATDEKAFLEGWMKARTAALAKASMPNGFE